MDKKTLQFFGDAKKLSLTETERTKAFLALEAHMGDHFALTDLEKADAFDRIAAHMKKHPLVEDGDSGSYVTRISWFFSMHKLVAATICAVLLIGAGGGGVTYAAEEAMPEDNFLYAVKLHLNEPLVGAFHKARGRGAHWEEKRLQRRMHEVEHLSKRGEFTPKRRKMLQGKIEKPMKMLQHHLENIPEERRAEFEHRIQKQFDRHEAFLQKREDGAASKEEIRTFRQDMHKARGKFMRPNKPPRRP